MSRDLLITLGHNASALVVEDGQVLNGYEAERLTGVKSDSRFPVDAILRLQDGKTFSNVFVTHWDPMNNVDSMKTKYWDRSFFGKTANIISQETVGMTHHDAHAKAALMFAGEDFPRDDTWVLVIDGFGSFAEHISYYRVQDDSLQLFRRIYGYDTSLGLMYQYATAFLGMKMHEDEYKLLGYGALIGEVDIPLDLIDEVAMRYAVNWLKNINAVPTNSGIDLDSLPDVQLRFCKSFDRMLDEVGMVGHNRSSHESRIVLGYIVQQILEICVRNLVFRQLREPSNLIVTGGVAYNVAMNRMLLNNVRGKVCFMPLAGDQGNAIGVWGAYRRQSLDFGDLCWGKRDYTVPEGGLPDGMLAFKEDGLEAWFVIHEALENEGFINVVRGNVEFGPRALCNTTTLARADDPKIAAEINRINGRNSVMPFAPVVDATKAGKIFKNIDRVHKSDRFMIVACDYQDGIGEKVPGAALRTAKGVLTGRPQTYAHVLEDDSVGQAVSHYGLLINTSFNVHGVPICCDLKHVIHSHQFQRAHNPDVRTIVIAA